MRSLTVLLLTELLLLRSSRRGCCMLS